MRGHLQLGRLLTQADAVYRLAPWQPAADVYRCTEGWLIKFDVAGVSGAEIELRVEGRGLCICGVRRDELVVKGQAYSMEIAYNRFERRVELPCALAGARLSSEYHDGMLIVRIAIEGAA